MPRRKAQAIPQKSGTTWTPAKGLTLVSRGARQIQARVRRTGWPSQTRTFETVVEAEAWGIDVLASMNRNVLVDQRRQRKTTLISVLQAYEEKGLAGLKGASQAKSQIKQLKRSSLAFRSIAEITTKDVLDWLEWRGQATVKRKCRDENGRTIRVKDGRKLVQQYADVPIGAKTVLNELSRLSAAFVYARTSMGLTGLRNPVEDVPPQNKPKPIARNRRLRSTENDQLLQACRESRCAVLAPIVELALETACRRSEIVTKLVWQDIDLDLRTAKIRDTKSHNGIYNERTIGLSTRAIEILTSLGPRKRGRVFSVRPDNITRNFRKACERAAIADLKLHDQRSEAASRMAEVKGLDIIQLSEQGGWRSIQQLKKYYRPDPKVIAAKLG